MPQGGPMPASTTLDGNPPNPTGPGQAPTLQQVSPSQQFGGTMQITQLFLQAATQAASLIDLMGQANPRFAPLAQDLIERLKGGMRSTLQQGTQPPGAAIGSLMGGGPGAAPPAGPSQAPPPMLQSGM